MGKSIKYQQMLRILWVEGKYSRISMYFLRVSCKSSKPIWSEIIGEYWSGIAILFGDRRISMIFFWRLRISILKSYVATATMSNIYWRTKPLFSGTAASTLTYSTNWLYGRRKPLILRNFASLREISRKSMHLTWSLIRTTLFRMMHSVCVLILKRNGWF